MTRYDRQIRLPEIGRAGQAKLAGASVLCVGAGGLGCPALLYLAAAGVGRIGVMDFDQVDESNLQRQVLYSTAQIGENKAEAAKTRLEALNPTIEITAIPERLDGQNAERLFTDYDVIIDGTDNFTTKFLINDAAVKVGKPFIYGSILGFEGQVSVFNVGGSACYRCLFPEAPKTPVMNCAEAGVIGAVAGMVGTVQAMEVVKLIVGHESFKPLVGQLWMIDVCSMSSKIMDLPKDTNCPVCSKKKEEIIMPDHIEEITVEEARQSDALFVDVREQDEWDAGHIEGAAFLPLSALANGAQGSWPKDQALIIYCRSGYRSMQACHILQAQGYTNLSNLKGGILAWG